MIDYNYINSDVSIIVPLFHGKKYLDNILQMTKENVESASDMNIELILVNDSPDDVPDFSILENTEFKTHVVLNEKNLGIQRSRLQGVNNSHGKYLFFLDQDDVVSDDIIKRLYDSVNGEEISVCDWVNELFDDAGDIYEVNRVADIKKFTLKRLCIGGNVIGPPGHCLIRRDCLPRCFTKRIMEISGADDFLLWVGVLAEGRKFIHCEGSLYVHKIHSECFSNDFLNMQLSEDEAFSLAADEYGISAFWKLIHRRYINYRRLHFAVTKKSNKSLLKKCLCYLVYPDVLFFNILDKLGIYV